MNAGRAIVASIILALGTFSYLNPELIDDWIVSNHVSSEDYDTVLVGLQNEENWLVLRVSFDNNGFNGNAAVDLLGPESPAQDYISQLSSGDSTLTTTFFGEIWHSPHDDRFWGADGQTDRDSGTNGAGVEQLASSVITARLDGVDLSEWDLNGDYLVDRLLILHSAQPQETGGGSNAIWSHFSELNSPIVLGDWTVGHYTIASTDSGLGTVIHEMAHQMGALDLYDVHSELPTNTWNGIGDWGLMGSGNWNEGGDSPALPTASTLGLIGANRSVFVDPRVGGVFEIQAISDGGNYLTIAGAENEYFHLSLRDSVGFDSALPGHGILVEHQDRDNGDESNNLVNTDPKDAWVKIIEADGDSALIRNRDRGSSGDVFGVGSIFGGVDSSEGMMIRDNHGRLVEWTAEFSSFVDGIATITFNSTSTSNSANVLTPHAPLELLPGESAFAEVSVDSPCELSVEIYAHPSLSYSELIQIPAGESLIPIIDITTDSPSNGQLSGEIGCVGESKTDIKLDWYKIGHRLKVEEIRAIIPHSEPAIIELNPTYIGDGSRDYDIAIEGAAQRIASSDTQGEVNAGDPIRILIEPNGLLTPGMIARGELILQDEFDIEQRIPIVFEAESSVNSNELLRWLSQPSNGLLIIAILTSLSVITGGKKPISKQSNNNVDE